MSIETMKQALEALENSVDLVVEDAYNAEQLYGNYPTRQGKVGGLKILAEAHKKAITALRQAIEQAQKQEPFWFAVVSKMSPVINKAIKSEEIAHEYADKCRENYDCDDLEIVPLYTSPPQRQPEQTNVATSDTSQKRVDETAKQQHEPVAWMDADGNVSDNNDHKCFPIPLYTHPPQRTEPPDWFPAVENILNEYGLQAIDFVADFKAAMTEVTIKEDK